VPAHSCRRGGQTYSCLDGCIGCTVKFMLEVGLEELALRPELVAGERRMVFEN
jgi:hypothetical protein